MPESCIWSLMESDPLISEKSFKTDDRRRMCDFCQGYWRPSPLEFKGIELDCNSYHKAQKQQKCIFATFHSPKAYGTKMVHTKSQGHRHIGYGEAQYFLRVSPCMGMAATLAMWPGPNMCVLFVAMFDIDILFLMLRLARWQSRWKMAVTWVLLMMSSFVAAIFVLSFPTWCLESKCVSPENFPT